MPQEASVLTHQQAQAFYDRMGKKQDWQAFYEAKATHNLITYASFETAQAVFEFGCGTGALAERLLTSHLSPSARYIAVDSSTTMIRLAQARLVRFGNRVTVEHTNGSLQCGAESSSFDRFVSTYVADLLSTSDIAALFGEAHRLLLPGDRLWQVAPDNRDGPVLPPGRERVGRPPSALSHPRRWMSPIGAAGNVRGEELSGGVCPDRSRLWHSL